MFLKLVSIPTDIIYENTLLVKLSIKKLNNLKYPYIYIYIDVIIFPPIYLYLQFQTNY